MTCEQDSAAFAERQQLRADVIAVVKTAIKMWSSSAVFGASERYVPQLVQLTSVNRAPSSTPEILHAEIDDLEESIAQ